MQLSKLHPLVIGTLCAGLGFVAGQWLQLDGPPPVVQEEFRATELDAIAEHEITSQSRELNITRVEGPMVRIVKRTIRVPDGTITTEDEHVTTGPVETGAQSVATTIEIREMEKVVYKDRETVRIAAAPLPTWHVSVQGGASAREPLIGVPGAPWAVVGVSVERQLFGPVSAGLWASSVGAGGVSLGVAW